jgi:hypothetical protein
MPLFLYRCVDPACDHDTEELFKADGERPLEWGCEECGDVAKLVPSVPARTASRWGDTNGGYDVDLGCVVENSTHRDRILKERNMAHASDFGGARGVNEHNEKVRAEKPHMKAVGQKIRDTFAEARRIQKESSRS